MRILLVLVVLSLGQCVLGDESTDRRSELNTTIDRGLAFLAKDALAWKKEHNCVSCHHGGLVAWALRDAKQVGLTVDEPVLAEMTKWVAESGNGKTGVPRPANIPKALNAKAVWFALSLQSDPKPDEATRTGIGRMLETIKEDQLESGLWASWPETRPPFFGNSDESMSVLALLALLPAAQAGDDSAKRVVDRGIQWLQETKSDDDSQSVTMRLVLWKRLNRSADELNPLVQRIRERQNEDGGWSQAKEIPSDGWATGQALYALSTAGLKSADTTISRGQAFLIKTQREDGAWPMTSRPTKPGDPGAMSLIPITGGGSAWAMLGLVHTW